MDAIESISIMFKQYDKIIKRQNDMVISGLWWKQYDLMCEEFVQTIKIQEEQSIISRMTKSDNEVDTEYESKKLFGGCLYDWSQHEFSSDDDFEIITEPPVPIARKCLCTNIIGVKKICLRQVCTFAHNVDEWTPEVCAHNDECNNKSKCMRLHGQETKEEAATRLGIEFLSAKKYSNMKFHILKSVEEKKKSEPQQCEQKVKPLPKLQEPIIRKCICKHVLSEKKSCNHNACSFAHNVNEWSPETCSFGNKCRNISTCMRLHGKETKEQAAKRLGFVPIH